MLTTRKNKSTHNQIFQVIKPLISWFDTAKKVENSFVRQSKPDLVQKFQDRADQKPYYFPGLNPSQYQKHCSNQDTYYFTGSHERAPQTLVMIDLDCHKTGTLDDAIQFADYMKTFYPNLYTEVSTNHNGIHQYFILEKQGYDHETVKAAMKRLGVWMEHQRTTKDFRLEKCEVKGEPPVGDWRYRNGRAVPGPSFKMGTLAKLPRTAHHRPEQFKKMPVITVDELLALPIPKDRQRSEPSGSTPTSFIQPDDLIRLPVYRKIADHLLQEYGIRPTGRQKVTTEDIALLLTILKKCSDNPNEDGSMPFNRIKTIWDTIYANGCTDRAFDSHRYKAMRELLEIAGLVVMKSPEYTVGHQIAGSYVKGQAMKWGVDTVRILFFERYTEFKEKKRSIGDVLGVVRLSNILYGNTPVEPMEILSVLLAPMSFSVPIRRFSKPPPVLVA